MKEIKLDPECRDWTHLVAEHSGETHSAVLSVLLSIGLLNFAATSGREIPKPTSAEDIIIEFGAREVEGK